MIDERHREVAGTHWSRRRLRLDAVLEPKDPRPRKDDRPAVGVEFRLPDELSFDTRRFTRWAAQAIDYGETEWDSFGRLIIFGCPSPMRRIAASGWGPNRPG
jgi:hypothetical protein